MTYSLFVPLTNEGCLFSVHSITLIISTPFPLTVLVLLNCLTSSLVFFTHVRSLSPSFSLFRYHPWSTLTFLHTYSLLCVAQHAVSFFIYTRSHAFLMFKITTARTGADCQNIQYTHAHVTFSCNSVCSAVYELLPDHQNHFPLLVELQRFIDAMSLHYEAPRPPRVSRCR